MKIIVTARIDDRTKGKITWGGGWGYAWTFYNDKGDPVARSEYEWLTVATARKHANAFKALIGLPNVPIKVYKLGKVRK